MNTVEKYGSNLQTFNKFVAQLDPAVRLEAFKFLIARHFNQPTVAEKATAVLAEPSQPESHSQHRALAPQELLRRVGASTIFEKAVLFGYWLEMHHGNSSFSGSKLKDVFEMAREFAPANPSDVVAKLEKSGKLMRAEKVGATQHYRLTRTAIDEIESKIN